jgi:hypothetical protein
MPPVRTKEILELFAERGLKQNWVAAQIGYHPTTFNDVIHNRNGARLNPQKVSALTKCVNANAEILGVPHIPEEKISRLFGIRYKPSLEKEPVNEQGQ